MPKTCYKERPFSSGHSPELVERSDFPTKAAISGSAREGTAFESVESHTNVDEGRSQIK